MTLFEKIKEAIRMSDAVGRSRGSNGYAINEQAVNRLVVLEIGLEAEIKAALDAKDAEIAALKAEMLEQRANGNLVLVPADQLRKMKDEMAALRKDAERLDWLAANSLDALDIFGCTRPGEGRYVRQSIDKAIAQAAQSS